MMKRMTTGIGLLLVAALALAAEYKQLGWEDLLPGGVAPPMPSHDGGYMEPGLDPNASPAYPIGVVSELNGEAIKIPGFPVPLDVSGDEVTSMLLVPYFGACIHLPPPPANQVVYVEFETPAVIESLWEPVWVTGTMTLESFTSGVGDASYTLKGDGIEVYDY